MVTKPHHDVSANANAVLTNANTAPTNINAMLPNMYVLFFYSFFFYFFNVLSLGLAVLACHQTGWQHSRSAQ
jgi:hypothetical protein